MLKRIKRLLTYLLTHARIDKIYVLWLDKEQELILQVKIN